METTVQKETIKPISQELALTNFNLALTEKKFQEIQDEVDELEINETNLDVAKEILAKESALLKVIKEAHEKAKKPYLEGSRNIDAARKDIEGVITGIFSKKKKDYADMCVKVAKAAELEKQNQERINRIKQGIANNSLTFSMKIAACTTDEELLGVERLINLEKGRKEKYAEFYESTALPAFNELTTLIKSQKEVIRRNNELKRTEEEALQKGDDAAVLEAREELERNNAAIQENALLVQEKAINTATAPDDGVEVIHPSAPTAKRRALKWKLETDLETLRNTKKLSKYFKIVPDVEAIDALIEQLRNDKVISLDMTEEYKVGELIIYVEKQYA